MDDLPLAKREPPHTAVVATLTQLPSRTKETTEQDDPIRDEPIAERPRYISPVMTRTYVIDLVHHFAV
jgi:hypothetical protein